MRETFESRETIATVIKHLGRSRWWISMATTSCTLWAPPGTAEYYRKTGKFADGTVLMKEVFDTAHAQLTTGDGYWASGTKVWFVMIKDTKGRYPGNPLWGDGWGWALFKSDAPDKQVATDFKKDCLGCHSPAKHKNGF